MTWIRRGLPRSSRRVFGRCPVASSLTPQCGPGFPFQSCGIDYDVWLNPEATNPAILTNLFEPAPADELVATAVNPAVNNARHEGVCSAFAKVGGQHRL